eukprot:233644_1
MMTHSPITRSPCTLMFIFILTPIVSFFIMNRGLSDVYAVQLKEAIKSEPHINDIKHEKLNHYDEKYISSYDNWIRGIGDRSLLNNLSSDANCLFPSIPASIEHDQAINNDFTFQTIKNHKSKQFSSIFNRVITVDCLVYPRYQQSDSIFNGNIPDANTMNTMSISYKINATNIWILHLNPATQTTWIWCSNTFNFHYSLLPLSTLNATQYNEKKQRIQHHFGGKRPPNVILFVIDSTSRAQFIRSSPRTVDYLSNLMLDRNGGSPSNVYEFYRYSTVAWGTSYNMPALIGGTCAHCDERTKFKHCKGLNTFYDEFGYYVVGMEEYFANIDSGTFQMFSWEDRNDPTTNHNQDKFKTKYHIPRSVDLLDFTQNFSKIFGTADASDKRMKFVNSLKTYKRLDSLHCDYLLAGNVFPRYAHHTFENRFDTELAAEFALQMINELQVKRDKHVPYFMVLHTKANHNKNNAFYLDRYLVDMLELIDKQNTIIHLIADHGTYQRTGIYGELEARNPVSILIAPKAIAKAVNKNNNLYNNQQKMVTHFDMHLFYKELLYNLLANKKDDEYNSTIAAYLPRSNDGKILSQSIISTRIKSDRSCDGIARGYCFCDSLAVKQPKHGKAIMKVIISKINQMTGNGQYMCRKLNANDFEMTSHIVAKRTKSKYITIQSRRSPLIYTAEMLSNYTIPIVSRKVNLRVFKITRIDYFKYEACITTKYDPNIYSSMHSYFSNARYKEEGVAAEPTFVNQTLMARFLSNVSIWNLRLCNCN